MLIALSPLLTDLPTIVLSIYFLQLLSDNELIYGLLSVAGGLFLVYISIQDFRFDPNDGATGPAYRSSLKIGVITNLLSPHPYIFWTAIGAPAFIKAGEISVASQAFFIVGFYLMLVGAKVGVAMISAKAKDFLRSSAYKNIIRFMGLVLLALAAILLYDGVHMIIGKLSG
jgi:threonine/homoserine/homoserine lactone efflux protein